MAAAEGASDLMEPLVGGPEVDAGNKGGGKQVNIDYGARQVVPCTAEIAKLPGVQPD